MGKLKIRHISLFSILRHFCFWLLFIGINWLMSSTKLSYINFINYHLVYFLISFLFFYVHYYLIGFTVKHKKYSIYKLLLISLLEIIVFSFLLESVLYLEIDHKTPDYKFTITEFSLDLYFTSLMIIGASLFYLIKDHFINKQKMMRLEIQFLKDQIKPHYFNNELNTLLNFVSKGDIETSEAYIKDLSEYLVYALKNDINEKVSLKEEIHGLFSYLDNFERRNTKSLNIDYSIEGKSNNLKIHPLILITFIENSIKYSEIENNENAFISLSIKILKDNLTFILKNTVAESISENKISLGIGLNNVKRRLDLQYKNQYSLTEIQINNTFEIQLYINLI